jgi:hypothetical protein
VTGGPAGHGAERRHQLLQVVRRQVGVLCDSSALLERCQLVLEDLPRNALDDLAVHLHEPAVAVPGEPGIARLSSQTVGRLVRDAESLAPTLRSYTRRG